MSTEETNKAAQAIIRAIDSAKGSLIITDENARVLFTNPTVTERTGFHAPQVIGLKAGVLWGGNMSKSFYVDMWHTLKYTHRPWVGNVENAYKNTQQQDVLHIAPVLNKKLIRPAYFIEVHHTPEKNRPEPDYTQEFSEVCGQSQETEKILPQMMQWLIGSEKAQLLNEQTHIIADQHPYLVEALEHLVIYPTQQQYAYRIDDEEYIARAKFNPEEFNYLYEKYKNDIYKYFVKRTGVVEVVEDLTHDTFLAAFAHLPQYTLRNASYRTYLFRIAHNRLVNYYREQSKINTKIDNPRAHDIGQAFDIQLMWEHTDLLSKLHKDILHLKYKQGYSVREIADGMEKSENSIKLHLSRARKKLHEIFRKKNQQNNNT